MQRRLLFILFLVLATMVQAQYVFINQPEDCEGALRFSPTADWGANLSTDIWTSDVAIVMDDTGNPTQGCDPLVNAADLVGKIAFADRGSCNFSLKALNAQNAGAIALIIANNIPGAGTFNMGAGNFATDVTIPVVMINYEDGQILKEKMSEGTLNMSIGALEFENDLGVATTTALFPGYSTIPLSIAQEDAYTFVPGGSVTNYGATNGTNVAIETDIEFTSSMGGSTSVHNSAASVDDIPPDSSTLIVTGSYNPDQMEEGVYTFNYEVTADATDEVPLDNSFSENITVSGNYLSKVRWDATSNRPMRTQGFTIAGGGSIEMITPFEIQNATLDPTKPARVDSVIFQVSTSLPTLANIDITVFVYKWDDMDQDGNFASEEVELIGFGIQEFGPNETRADAWVSVLVEDLINGTPGYELPEGTSNIIVGTRYEGNDLVFFGFDEGVNFDQYINGVHGPAGTYSDAKLPYAQTTTFGPAGADFDQIGLFTDTWFASSTSLYIQFSQVSTNNLTENQIDARILGNPLRDQLNFEVNLKDHDNSILRYRLVDSHGRLIRIIKAQGVYHDSRKVDVTNLIDGQYSLIIETDLGMHALAFTKQ